MKDTLFIIPARGGSKGIPKKNIKILGTKPLIMHSVDLAKKFVSDDCICVSTDCREIIDVLENNNLKVPFIRPADLSTDTSGTYEVILHALKHYEEKGKDFAKVVLLQPTSPYRTKNDIQKCLDLFSDDMDMVVSVKKIKANPFAVLYQVNDSGKTISPLFKGTEKLRRQDAESVVELNGAVYVYKVGSLKKSKPSEFTNIGFYIMDEYRSTDLDTPMDWAWAEFLLENKLVNLS